MHRLLLRYNARVCAGLGPWIIVVPVASTMLVLFALMAMTSLIGAHTPVLVLEMLGSILMAFVSVNLLRPEYQYDTLETVLTRPVSFRVTLTVRALFAAVAILALEALLALYVRTVMGKPFNMGLALLSAAVSMAALAALAAALTAAWRSPTFGFVGAGLVWAADLLVGPSLNPLVTLRGYAADLATPDREFGLWWLGKLILAALAACLAWVAVRAGTRPAPQRSLGRWLRTAAGALLVLCLYGSSGALYKLQWGQRHEAELLGHARLWYRTAFAPYGPAPLAYVGGPAFPRYLGYRAPWDPRFRLANSALVIDRDWELERLRQVAFGYPDSAWADNALFDLGRMTLSEDPSAQPAADESRLGAECLELLARDYPSSPFVPLALEKLAGAYTGRGHTEEAQRVADRLLTVYPTSPSTAKVVPALVTRLADPNAPAGRRLAEAVTLAGRLAKVAQGDARPQALLQYGALLADPQVARHSEAAQALTEAAAAARDAAQQAVAGGNPGAEDIQLMRQMGDLAREAQARLESLP